MAGSTSCVHHSRPRSLGRRSTRRPGGPSPAMSHLANPRSNPDKNSTIHRGEQGGFGGSSLIENCSVYNPDDYMKWHCGSVGATTKKSGHPMSHAHQLSSPPDPFARSDVLDYTASSERRWRQGMAAVARVLPHAFTVALCFGAVPYRPPCDGLEGSQHGYLCSRGEEDPVGRVCAEGVRITAPSFG
jgi:hypothetical protein